MLPPPMGLFNILEKSWAENLGKIIKHGKLVQNIDTTFEIKFFSVEPFFNLGPGWN